MQEYMMNSTQNFILVNKNVDNNSIEDQEILLKLGKTSERTFSMDFVHPLTPIQAFGICLSFIDNNS
jgi:hypothetical protein